MVTARFLGHACWTLSDGTHTLIIDPFLKDNPLAPVKPSEIRAEAVLVSHAHFDHIADALEIAKKNNALVVSTFEIVSYLQGKGARGHGMHIGGAHQFPFAWVKLTPALHGSTVHEGNQFITLGNPCGFLVRIANQTIYHAGDTGLFGDMALIGERHPIDLALLPIGDNYTMGIDDAVEAVRLLKPRKVIPMHYNTFDLIRVNAEEFARKVREKTSTEPIILQPGESYTLS